MAGKPRGGRSQSLGRAILLLRLVAANAAHGARLSDLARRAKLSKPTAHRLLSALEREGLIHRDGDSMSYHLGPEAFVLGTLAAERYGIHRTALPALYRLSAVSGDTSFLTVRRDWQSVCLHREEGAFPIRTHALKVGDRLPLGIGAGGMAILAALSDEDAEAAIAANAAEIATRYPGYSPAVLRNDRELAHRHGFAFNPGRLTAGSCGVAVAVRDAHGECIGALSVAAIEQRLAAERRQELATMLRTEVERLESQLTRPEGASQIPAPRSEREHGASAPQRRT
ncbi:IclR family transcriptional regulator [Peristeroidobacter soli]|uniref:IclR family transcriptional regulator n=1 Tax=Peristeroidobacter soli TaxID=2497877 RepID=UPI00101D6F5D|nr:IclR family transcriptional regulator [Peristeroidobacter soli]